MIRRPATRGQPILVLGLLLGSWVGLRAVTWQSPFDEFSANVGEALSKIAPRANHSSEQRPSARVPASSRTLGTPLQQGTGAPLMPPMPYQLPEAFPQGEEGGLGPVARTAPIAPAEPRHLIGHHIMLAAAFSQMEVPAALLPYVAAARLQSGDAAVPAPAGVVASRPYLPSPVEKRWSADAWLMLRDDTASTLTPGLPSYGRSQAGAVLRYRLAPGSSHRPVAYARVTRALAGTVETEVAAGLYLRPVPSVPVSVSTEVRVFDGQAGREARPSAFAVTELSPASLPFGARGEAYLQGGYVGGELATPFVDGQVRVDRDVAPLGKATLRAGAAAWGGAQKSASRLDIGPSATLSFRLGETNSRIALDYRFRVAGNAEPASGPALTISAGF